MSNFHLLEVVGRGSDTQLQVGENLNYLILGVISSLSELCIKFLLVLHICYWLMNIVISFTNSL